MGETQGQLDDIYLKSQRKFYEAIIERSHYKLGEGVNDSFPSEFRLRSGRFLLPIEYAGTKLVR